MAKTFLTGPVQSANGFQQITKNATTGAVTTTSTFGDDTTITGTMTQDISVVGTYTVATVPDAVAGGIIYVSDGAAGSPILAFSDGTDWLRSDTGAAVAAA
jgi:hypothetical protein